MGQSASCFADNADDNYLSTHKNGRTSLHPLSSQDAEIDKSRHDTIDVTISTLNHDTNKSSHDTQCNTDLTWNKFPSLEQEDVVVHKNPFNTHTDTFSDSSNHKLTQLNENRGSKRRKAKQSDHSVQKRVPFTWKKKVPQSSLNRGFQSRIMTLRVDPLHKIMFYFAETKSRHSGVEVTSRKISQRPLGLNCPDINHENKDDHAIMEYKGSGKTFTKLVLRDMAEVRNALVRKLPNQNKQDTYVEPILLCGTQIFSKRFKVNDDNNESLNCVENGKSFSSSLSEILITSDSSFLSLQDVNPCKANRISKENLREILRIRQNIDLGLKIKIPKESRGTIHFEAQEGLECCSANPIEKGELLSVTVPNGISRKLFNENAVLNTSVEPGMCS